MLASGGIITAVMPVIKVNAIAAEIVGRINKFAAREMRLSVPKKYSKIGVQRRLAETVSSSVALRKFGSLLP